MSLPGETEYGKGSFPRTWNSKTFGERFDEIDWTKRPQNTVLLSGEALQEYAEQVEKELGPIPDGIVTSTLDDSECRRCGQFCAVCKCPDGPHEEGSRCICGMWVNENCQIHGALLKSSEENRRVDFEGHDPIPYSGLSCTCGCSPIENVKSDCLNFESFQSISPTPEHEQPKPKTQ